MPDPGVRQDQMPQQVSAAKLEQLNQILNIQYATVQSARTMGKDGRGNLIYEMVVVGPGTQRTTLRKTLINGIFKNPIPKLEGSDDIDIPGEGDRNRSPQEDPLVRAKDEARIWVGRNAKYMSENERNNVLAKIESRTSVDSLNRYMKLIESNLPLGHTGYVEQPLELELPGGGGGGGGGRGSSISGPVYRAPDERVVEDFVKGALVSLVGTIPDDLVAGLKSIYMRDHKRNWQSEDREIDPSQSVLAEIRNTKRYQEIHALRPESDDERSWVSSRKNQLAQGGLSTNRQEDFAIEQAKVGGDLKDLGRAGAFEEVRATGSTQGTALRGKLEQVASQVFRGAAV